METQKFSWNDAFLTAMLTIAASLVPIFSALLVYIAPWVLLVPAVIGLLMVFVRYTKLGRAWANFLLGD